jgi:hypothetical protein
MTTIGNESRPAYVYDAETDTWVPIGVGPHTHDEYIDKAVITAKGDVIVGTASESPAKLAVGANNTYLKADSSTPTGLVWDPLVVTSSMIQNGTIVNEDISASAAIATSKLAANSVTINGQSIALGATALVTPSQNYLINGGMDIWQRGLTNTASSAQPYSADRWETFRASFAAGLTVTREASGVQNIQYCARVRRDLGNASTNFIVFAQNIETINSIPLRGKTVTLSFYLRRGANFSGSNLLAVIQTGTGTDQSSRAGYSGASTETLTISPTEFWTRYTMTRTIPTNANTVGIYFRYTPTGTAGSNDWFEVTGVQLEEGSVETSFRRHAPSIAGELAACHRYYYRTFNDQGTASFAAVGSGYASGTTGLILVNYPTLMRVVPSFSVTSPTLFRINNGITTADLVSLGPSIGQISAETAFIAINLNGTLTAGTSIIMYRQANTTSFLEFSAEI